MALSFAALHTLVGTNLANDSNILPVEHREVEDEIINKIEEVYNAIPVVPPSSSETKFSGYITHDWGSAGTPTYSFVDDTGASASVTVTEVGAGELAVFNVVIPSYFASAAKYRVMTSVSVNGDADLNVANDTKPVLVNKLTATNFQIVCEDSGGQTRFYTLDIEIKLNLY